MKTQLILIPFIAVSLAFSGCETTRAIYKAATEGVNLSASGDLGVVGDDVIIVRTEQALNIALDTFDIFLKIEHDNREGLSKVSPKIHEFAENVRRNGKKWIKSAQAAKNAYRDNRTPQNHANLVTAYKTLQEAINQSKQYIEKHSGV